MSINNYYSRFKKEKESLVCTSCVSFISFTIFKINFCRGKHKNGRVESGKIFAHRKCPIFLKCALQTVLYDFLLVFSLLTKYKKKVLKKRKEKYEN